MSEHDRRLLVAGLENLRDIGGYPTVNGSETRWRVVLRSDSPHGLPDSSVAQLLGHGVRTVLDLRRSTDVQHHPNVMATVPAVRYIHIPFNDGAPPPTAFKSMDDMFRCYIDECQEGLAKVFAALATGDRAMVVHCTNGLHRTGIVSALCLSLAGVPKALVAQDFAFSAECLGVSMETARARMVAQGWDPEQMAWFPEARPEVMTRALDYLDERYGGVAGYLSSIGVSAEHVSLLRRDLVGDAGKALS